MIHQISTSSAGPVSQTGMRKRESRRLNRPANVTCSETGQSDEIFDDGWPVSNGLRGPNVEWGSRTNVTCPANAVLSRCSGKDGNRDHVRFRSERCSSNKDQRVTVPYLKRGGRRHLFSLSDLLLRAPQGPNPTIKCLLLPSGLAKTSIPLGFHNEPKLDHCSFSSWVSPRNVK